jgi:hypothetical protein
VDGRAEGAEERLEDVVTVVTPVARVGRADGWWARVARRSTSVSPHGRALGRSSD